MSISASSGVLHTNSAYFAGTAASYNPGGGNYAAMFDNNVIISDLMDALAYAESKELEFYHLYFPEVSDYRSFLAKVRELFSEAGDDAKLILGLSNAVLKKYMPKNITDIGTEHEIKIILTGKPADIPLEKLNTQYTTLEGGNVCAQITQDNAHQIIKDLKAIIGRGETSGLINQSRKGRKDIFLWSGFGSGKKVNIDRLDAWIQDQSQEILDKLNLKFEIKEKPGDFEITDNTKAIIQPFTKYKKSDIEKMTGDPKFEAEFEKAYNQIKDFILGPLLKGSDILKQAATKAWNAIVGDVKSELRGYFFEGANVYKSVLGNGGEFQLKVIDNYLAIATGKYNEGLGKVVGGIGSGKRQEPRSDFQIMSTLGADVGNFVAGIQVKNVSEGTGTTIHISTDLELMAPGLPEGFRDTLANSMFNSDIKSAAPDIEQTLKDYVEAYFWRAMNLHVGDGLNPNHTNTFYFYGGTSLIPASEIIGDMINAATKTKPPEFTVDGLTAPIGSDSSFAERHGSDRKPNFLEYWDTVQYLGFGQGAVLDENTLNTSLYNNLLAGVSVRSVFSLTAVASSLSNVSPIELFPH